MKNKKLLLLACLLGLFLLAGCQSNLDQTGKILAERIIYLDTPWSKMFDESIFSALLVYPLAQCINYIGTQTNSAVLGVVLTTLAYNVLTLVFSINQTINSQKIQILQPELNRIQAKYAGRNDENARMQMGQEMQALYNKHKVNPLGSLITPFLTLPIMICMLYAAQRAEVLVHGSFLGASLQITPLDALKDMTKLWPLVVIYVIMLVLQVASLMLPQHLAKLKRKQQKGYKSYDDNNSGSNQMNTMLYSSVALIGFLGIRWPSAMSVYWAVSSLASVLKTIYIQRRYIDNEPSGR